MVGRAWNKHGQKKAGWRKITFFLTSRERLCALEEFMFCILRERAMYQWWAPGSFWRINCVMPVWGQQCLLAQDRAWCVDY